VSSRSAPSPTRRTGLAEFLLLARLDLRLLARHGVVAAIVVVATVWAGLLAALPDELAADLVPAALYLDAAIIGLLFLGGAVLIERRQGSLEALAVSPLQPQSYVAAKVATLTGLAILAVLVIAVVAAPTVRPLELILATLLVSPPVLLVCMIVAARAVTVTDYLLRVQGPLSPAVVPLLAAAGWLPDALAWAGPTTGAFRLLEAGTGGTPLRAWEWLLAITVPTLASTLLWRVAVARVRSDLFRSGRLQ
jgi:fluoroquinolone transport system permease protein